MLKSGQSGPVLAWQTTFPGCVVFPLQPEVNRCEHVSQVHQYCSQICEHSFDHNLHENTYVQVLHQMD